MENLVLKVLQFDMNVPTILSFLDRYEKAADFPQDMKRKFCFLTRVCIEYILFYMNAIVGLFLHWYLGMQITDMRPLKLCPCIKVHINQICCATGTQHSGNNVFKY